MTIMQGISRLALKLSELYAEKRLPWKMTYLGGLGNTMIAVPLRRCFYFGVMRIVCLWGKQDICVIIPIRNRSGTQLENTINSILIQDYPGDLIKIVLIDYASEEKFSFRYRKMCREKGIRYLKVETAGVWNKAHCLNCGIRSARETFIFCIDSDIILACDYLRKGIELLMKKPLSVVYSQCMDLSEKIKMPTPETINPIIINELKESAIPRSSGIMNAGINMTYTHFYKKIRGYDESFQGWGSEDNDIFKRFEHFGLKSRSLSGSSFYLHQWHEKFDGDTSSEMKELIRRNERYFLSAHTIVRNDKSWGRIC